MPCRYLYIAGTAHEQEMFPFRRVVKLDMQAGTRDSWLAPSGVSRALKLYQSDLIPSYHVHPNLLTKS